VPIPVEAVLELLERTRSTKRMFVLRRADHAHFVDDIAEMHERARTMPVTGDWAYMQKEMRPIAELCSAEEAHLFSRGLALAHFDAVLKGQQEARRFWTLDIPAELKHRGVEAFERL